jgi:CrcB protein
MKNVLIVGCGGFLGAVARYLCSRALARGNVLRVPVATLVVNVAGCLLFGALMAWVVERGAVTSGWRLFLGVGFLASFTTFSTFGFETLVLLRVGDTRAALASVALNVVLGLAAVALGAWIATPFISRA